MLSIDSLDLTLPETWTKKLGENLTLKTVLGCLETHINSSIARISELNYIVM